MASSAAGLHAFWVVHLHCQVSLLNKVKKMQPCTCT